MSIGAPLVGTLNTNTTAATTNNVPYPASLTSSHIMVLGISVNSALTTGATLPAGWTQVFKNSSGSGTSAPCVLVAIKQATGSESGNLAVTTASAKSTAQIIAFSGVNLTTPQDVTATSVDDTVGHTGLDLPTLTTTRPGDALVYFGGKNNGAETATAPTGFTETGDNAGTGGWAGTMGYQIQAVAGATGTVTITFSGTAKGVGVLLALRNADLGLASLPLTATGTRTGDLLLGKNIDGTAVATAALSGVGVGALHVDRPLDGDAAAAAAIAGTLALNKGVAGDALATASITGSLGGTLPLDGTAIAAAAIVGTLAKGQPLDGNLTALATISGDLGVVRPGRLKLIDVRAGPSADWAGAGTASDGGDPRRDIRRREIVGNTDRGSLAMGTAATEQGAGSHEADLAFTAMHGPPTVATKTANYAVTAADWVVVGNGSSITITLPTPVGITGRHYTIKNIHSTALALATAGGVNIDGAATQSIAQWASLEVVSNGTQWLTV